MENKKIVAIILFVLVLLIVSLVLQLGAQNNKSADTATQENEQKEAPSPIQPPPTPTRYFSSSSDKVVINVGNRTLYTNNPSTTIDYHAIDSSNRYVTFRSGDRAFVRILGITREFSNNIEIFHPKISGSDSKNSTIFSGNITFPEAGVYLVKVCLGPKINLDEAGNNVWPFGCFEDQTSVQVNVYEKA